MRSRHRSLPANLTAATAASFLPALPRTAGNAPAQVPEWTGKAYLEHKGMTKARMVGSCGAQLLTPERVGFGGSRHINRSANLVQRFTNDTRVP